MRYESFVKGAKPFVEISLLEGRPSCLFTRHGTFSATNVDYDFSCHSKSGGEKHISARNDFHCAHLPIFHFIFNKNFVFEIFI